MPGGERAREDWNTAGSAADRFNAFTLTIALSKVTFSERAAGLAMRAPKHHACLASRTKTAGSSSLSSGGGVTQLFLAGNAAVGRRANFYVALFSSQSHSGFPVRSEGGTDDLVLIIESTNWSSFRGSGSLPKYNR